MLRMPVGPDINISIHAPREGCDRAPHGRGWRLADFNPRTPRGVRHVSPQYPLSTLFNFNPRTPRGVRQLLTALRDEQDKNFNPRTPRGVRPELCGLPSGAVNFNPRTPRGVRLLGSMLSSLLSLISIHAPREGCDSDGAEVLRSMQQFQSTHPARGATANFTKEQRVCLAQFAYLHKGKKAEHTKTNAPMLHEAFLYAFWVRTGRRRRVLLDFARYKIKGSSGR